jgi:hypothetical protein
MVTDWLTAIGTIGAFAVSLYLLRRDQVYRDQAVRFARGEQFRMVSAWVETAGGSGDADGWHWQGRAVVNNISTEPVYGCVV